MCNSARAPDPQNHRLLIKLTCSSQQLNPPLNWIKTWFKFRLQVSSRFGRKGGRWEKLTTLGGQDATIIELVHALDDRRPRGCWTSCSTSSSEESPLATTESRRSMPCTLLDGWRRWVQGLDVLVLYRRSSLEVEKEEEHWYSPRPSLSRTKAPVAALVQDRRLQGASRP